MWQRFTDHGLIQAFFDALVRQAVVEGDDSDEHFSVDGTLLRSWASLKSLQPKDPPPPPEPPDDPGNPTVNFHGQRRTNSQRIRKRIEEIFGWCKTVGRLARTRFVGRWKMTQEVLVTLSAYNLVRLTTREARP